MGSVQARLGDFEDVLLYSEVEPRGLATAAVESLSGYVVRVANAYAVPAGVLFARALDAVSSRVDLRARQPRRDLVTGSAETEARAVQAMAALTGRDGLDRSRRARTAVCGRTHPLALPHRPMVSARQAPLVSGVLVRRRRRPLRAQAVVVGAGGGVPDASVRALHALRGVWA